MSGGTTFDRQTGKLMHVLRDASPMSPCLQCGMIRPEAGAHLCTAEVVTLLSSAAKRAAA